MYVVATGNPGKNSFYALLGPMSLGTDSDNDGIFL